MEHDRLVLDMKRDTSFFERSKEKETGKKLSLVALNYDNILIARFTSLAIYNFNVDKIR